MKTVLFFHLFAWQFFQKGKDNPLVLKHLEALWSNTFCVAHEKYQEWTFQFWQGITLLFAWWWPTACFTSYCLPFMSIWALSCCIWLDDWVSGPSIHGLSPKVYFIPLPKNCEYFFECKSHCEGAKANSYLPVFSHPNNIVPMFLTCPLRLLREKCKNVEIDWTCVTAYYWREGVFAICIN